MGLFASSSSAAVSERQAPAGECGLCESTGRSSAGTPAGRLASAAAAGALVVALTATGTTVMPDASAASLAKAFDVSLAAASSPNQFQPQIDAIIAAQQQITVTNSNYPFITEFDKTLLPAYLQQSAQFQLRHNIFPELNLLYSYNLNSALGPYRWNAMAADPISGLNSPNPDNTYNKIRLDGQRLVIRVDPGPGTQDVTFNLAQGTTISPTYKTIRAFDLEQFTPDADGSYTIIASAVQEEGNWVNTAGAQEMVIRNDIGNWGQPHSIIDVRQAEDPGFRLPTLSDEQIADILDTIAINLPIQNASATLYGLQRVSATPPLNQPIPIRASTTNIPGGPILGLQYTSGVHFGLNPDQALIVKVPEFVARYTGAQLNTAWTSVAPFVTAQSSVNNTQAFRAGDGFTYYVVSSQDPGVANWLDNSGLLNGNLILRWQGAGGAIPTTPVTAQVVNIADVKAALPADTPLVSPEQRAVELKQRLFEYGYIQNQNNIMPGWLTANLQYDQIRDAVGAEQFEAVFGSQAGVPSVLQRMISPALIPSPDILLRNIFTDPLASLSALIQNVPLAVQDVAAPVVLAVLRLGMVMSKTLQAVQAGFASGQLSQLIAALGEGIQGLGTVVMRTLTDPATSITAGLLNARDDLAVSVANADSYSAPTGADLVAAGKGVVKTIVDSFGILRDATRPVELTPQATAATSSATARSSVDLAAAVESAQSSDATDGVTPVSVSDVADGASAGSPTDGPATVSPSRKGGAASAGGGASTGAAAHSAPSSKRAPATAGRGSQKRTAAQDSDEN